MQAEKDHVIFTAMHDGYSINIQEQLVSIQNSGTETSDTHIEGISLVGQALRNTFESQRGRRARVISWRPYP
jgi:hypothetical protein